ncbi:MAG: NAD-binding protein, partial [Desulfobacterales bacterium]|nr:NAD-binding protein [Desulfobacterales bacterium]
HEIGISPAIGAFIAGLMLAGSPFATQVRSDVSSLRTVLVTLFFASVGMFADPLFAVNNAHWLLLAVVIVVLGKTLITGGIARVLGVPFGGAMATGLCLAQIGEFSFVLATIASAEGGPLTDRVFNLVVATTIISLMLTPFFVNIAPRITDALTRASAGAGKASPEPEDTDEPRTHRILLIGFGPAAQQVASAVMAKLSHRTITVLDINPRNVEVAKQFGLRSHVGDAQQTDVLEHAGIMRADALVITIPDANAARRIIEIARTLNPNLHILVRARYHVTRWELQMSGATVVVDEEEHVGNRLAEEAIGFLDPDQAK